MGVPGRRRPCLCVQAATFAGRAEEVSRLREVLRGMLEGCPAAYEVLLCASELAANAVLHSDTRKAGGTFTVRVEIRPAESVTIVVEDEGGCWAEPSPHPAHGRGLGIVGVLADDWGIRGTEKGRAVWARLGWSPDEAARAAGCRARSV